MAENEEALLIVGSLQIKYSVFENNKLLDVRKYYKDKTTKELKPTRKGISLNRLQFEAINNVFDSRNAEIEDWFSSVDNDKPKEIDALNSNRYHSNEVVIKFENWRGLEPFRFTCEGSIDFLYLNTSNAWVENLKQIIDEEPNSEKIQLVLTLIINFFKSINLLDTRNETIKELLDTIIGNWGIYSRKNNKEKIKIA